MSNILIIIFLIFYFILSKIRLDLAVMLLIMALPSYLIRFSIFNIPLTLLEAMILIAFIVWFLKNYKEIISNLKLKINYKFKVKNLKLKNYPFNKEIILLLIISFISIAVAGFTDSAFGIWKAYFFESILVFILIFNVFQNKEKKAINFTKIFWSITISAFIVSVFAIYQKITGNFIFNELWAEEKTRRVVSFFGYPNAVGLYLGPIILIMFGWLIEKLKNKSKKLKIVFIGLTIIISLLSIYFAKSEGALVGVIAGLIVFGLLSGRKIRLIIILLVFIFGTSIMFYHPIRDYAVKKIFLKDLSGEIRKQQWKETWKMMTESKIRFIFGSGLSNYQNAIKPYHQEGIFFNKENDPDFRRKIVIFNNKYRAEHWQPVEIYMYPHNIFLNFWTELGLAGLLLFVWIIIKFWIIGIKLIKNNNKNNKYLIIGLICSMVVIVIHGLVDVPYFKNDLSIIFWILIAMIGIKKITEECQSG